MIDVRAIARALGGEIAGRQILCPGPGHSPNDRSLAVRFEASAPDGFLVHSFAGDDPLQARDYVREKLGVSAWGPGDERDRRIQPSRVWEFDRDAVDRGAAIRPRTEEDIARIAMATRLWDQAGEPRGTAAEEYLKSRALKLSAVVAGGVLRFHARCPWRNENTGRTDRIPAMLAAFRSLDDAEITAVHRIRLDQPERWPKAERRMLGIVRQAAVKLGPVTDGTLAIGEGIETCLAAEQLGFKPAWALGSVGAISFFPIIAGISTLTILGETGEASATAIQFCGRRWHSLGRRVRIVRPDIGSDLNDVLIASAK
jgi:putative DNA primase/helicase